MNSKERRRVVVAAPTRIISLLLHSLWFYSCEWLLYV
jgi:hypothetical protein